MSPEPALLSPTGHVFVVRADLRYLACDDWLMPCDAFKPPLKSWFPEDHQRPPAIPQFAPGRRVQRVPQWPVQLPRAWHVNVGGFEDTPVQWYVDGAREFIERIAQETTGPTRYGRARRLIALPVVGTGAGGGLERAGDILSALLPTLRGLARQLDLDIVLVTRDAATYAAAQAERSRSDVDWFGEQLRPELRDAADSLARLARSGELALFLGAGVSMGAGVPGWNSLLQTLARQAGLSPQEQEAFLEVRSVLDQASLLERRYGKLQSTLGAAVADLVTRHSRYSLQHAILASLPVREVITTNYDQLFERAWQANHGDELSILPHLVRRNSRRWLLKMHGCVSHPEQIVLSRSSYTRYESNLPALSGIVQAFLVTRHVLFAGFSMTDDNFHRIADAVRRIRRPGDDSSEFGTSLCLQNVGMLESLWSGDIKMVTMDPRRTAKPTDLAEAARLAEIFLDYLTLKTRGSAHLLVGDRFRGVLEISDLRIRDAVEEFVARLGIAPDDSNLRDSVAWPEIRRMLEELGYSLKRNP